MPFIEVTRDEDELSKFCIYLFHRWFMFDITVTDIAVVFGVHVIYWCYGEYKPRYEHL